MNGNDGKLANLFGDEDHVPNSNDFIVYLVKKNHKMKVQRYYRCHCSLIPTTKKTEDGRSAN